mmetsp:Transcript_3556/g.11514  ORF Transcript_3556/g.11514 Transcript_3556/m.11514 type:complete len:219 (-) Transcript_3556:239-895(-)
MMSGPACSVGEDALVLVDKPLLRLRLGALVLEANLGALGAPLRNATAARPLHHDVKVHAIDASAGVVLEPEVDVLHDAKAKVARLREILLPQLVLLHLEAALQQLLRLFAADGHVARNLLVPPDAEGAHGVARCGRGAAGETPRRHGSSSGERRRKALSLPPIVCLPCPACRGAASCPSAALQRRAPADADPQPGVLRRRRSSSAGHSSGVRKTLCLL